MDRPRIRERSLVKHRKLAFVAGGFVLLSGVAFGDRQARTRRALRRAGTALPRRSEGRHAGAQGARARRPAAARGALALDPRGSARRSRAGARRRDRHRRHRHRPAVESRSRARGGCRGARSRRRPRRVRGRAARAREPAPRSPFLARRGAATAESARLQAIAEERAFQQGAVSELQTSRSKILAAQLGERVEDRGSSGSPRSTPPCGAQLQARQARLRQLERAHEERRLAADSLQVKAGIDGVVQSVPVQEGQQLAPGANVARVAKPGKLYAELRIPELDARDLAAGPSGDDRHARPPGARPRDPRRPRGDRGRGEGRDRLRRAAADAGARRPLGRRHHRDRDAEGRALRRPPGGRAVRFRRPRFSARRPATPSPSACRSSSARRP